MKTRRIQSKKTREWYDDKLEQEYLGEGNGSTVFAKPRTKTRVLKVVVDDPAYLKFIAMVMRRRKHNPCFPRVYSIVHHYQGDYLTHTVVELERLEEQDTVRYGRAKQLSDYIGGFLKEMPRYDFIDRNMSEALNTLRRFIETNKLSLTSDLGAFNIMQRPRTGQLVITDPVCGYK